MTSKNDCHPETGVPYRANDRAYAAIVAAVNACTAEYLAAQKLLEGVDDYEAAYAAQHAEDRAYIARVLADFAVHRNVEDLIAAVAQQDTLVRDYYAYIVNDLYSDYFNGEWE